MKKSMRLIFPGASVSAVAELLEAEAPRTCETIWNALDLSGELQHGIWSGPETYLRIDPSIRVGPENQTCQTEAGDIGYYALDGGRMVDWPDDLAEIAFFYGRGARPYMPTGPVTVNFFARIVDNLEGFARECARIRRDGTTTLRVERLS